MPDRLDASQVARRLGMVLSPAQDAYRAARRAGMDRGRARQNALAMAPVIAAARTTAVMAFIQTHARWSIPDEAWPRP